VYICAYLTESVFLLYSFISGDGCGECGDMTEVNFCGVAADMGIYIYIFADWHGTI
jgi:hypothetical protein